MMSEPPPKVLLEHIVSKMSNDFLTWFQGDEKPRKKPTEINFRKAVKNFARNALTRQEYYRLAALRDPCPFGEIV